MTGLAAAEIRRFGLEPKVALVSHSSFGTSEAASAVKMRGALAEIIKRYPGLEVEGEMHGDAALSEEVRMKGHAVVAFSHQMAEDLAQLRQFLHARMYRHFRVNRMRSQARRILAEMFALFMDQPDVLPPEWALRVEGRNETGRAHIVCDYIAGMTDRFAIEEHRRLFQLDVWN